MSSLATQDQEDIPVEVFVALEKEKRSWKENKKLKMAQRKDRRHFSDRTTRPYGAGRPKGKRGFNVDAIKKVSRCSNCGDRGHWAEDCKKPYRSKADRLEQEKQAKGGAGRGGPSAFVFLGASSTSTSSAQPHLGGFNYLGFQEEATYELALQEMQTHGEPYVQEKFNVEDYVTDGQLKTFVGMAIPEFAQRVLDQYRLPDTPQVFISLPGGHAIVDPGAGQDLIGQQAYERLKEKLKERGLRPIELEETQVPLQVLVAKPRPSSWRSFPVFSVELQEL